eukprot:1817394-Rhodomonas_salina.1
MAGGAGRESEARERERERPSPASTLLFFATPLLPLAPHSENPTPAILPPFQMRRRERKEEEVQGFGENKRGRGKE